MLAQSTIDFMAVQYVHSYICENFVMVQVLGGLVLSDCYIPVAARHFFSSTAAVWSQPGACHYSTANSFLDSLAQQSR